MNHFCDGYNLNKFKPSSNVNGSVTLDHVTWSAEQLEILTVSPVQWSKYSVIVQRTNNACDTIL